MARLIRATYKDGTTECVVTWSPADTLELNHLIEHNPDVIVWEVKREFLSESECNILSSKPTRVVYKLPKEYRLDPAQVRAERGEDYERGT